jgi:hypothetical protein
LVRPRIRFSWLARNQDRTSDASKGLNAMSKQAVSLVIHALLTNDDFRARFAVAPMEVLVDLHLSTGIELTLNEVEALVRASPDVWHATRALPRALAH